LSAGKTSIPARQEVRSGQCRAAPQPAAEGRGPAEARRGDPGAARGGAGWDREISA